MQNEVTLFTVTMDMETNELVARTEWGVEIARVPGDDEAAYAALAKTAFATLASWYN